MRQAGQFEFLAGEIEMFGWDLRSLILVLSDRASSIKSETYMDPVRLDLVGRRRHDCFGHHCDLTIIKRMYMYTRVWKNLAETIRIDESPSELEGNR